MFYCQHLKIACFFWLLVFTCSDVVHAFSVSPVHLEMGTLGRDARASITAVNHRGNRIGVDLSIVEVTLNSDGKVTEIGSGEEEFLIFPLQTFIQPYGKQVFRLQWAGDPEIDASRTFLISVTEVPGATRQEDSDETKASVTLALAFAVVVNVRPLEGEPAITVVSARLPDRSGLEDAPKVIADFRNDSKVHGVLARGQLTVSLLDKSGRQLLRRRYDASEINRTIGIGLLPPNQSRTLSIPLSGTDPEVLSQAASATVSVQLDKR